MGEIEGRLLFVVFHGFMKFCSLKELWWNAGKVGYLVFGVFIIL